MRCEERYAEIYGRDPEAVAFCPYRIAPLGAHIDHQNGSINGFAIDKGIHIAYGDKESGICELRSLNFPKRAQFHVRDLPEEKVGDWADHCRAAAKMLGEEYRLRNGISAVIEGSLPIGGLSSSAAVIIAFLSALAKVNKITLDPWETIRLAKKAENEYVGVNCGKLDQSCEVLCRKDHLLYLDCLDDSFSLIPKSEGMKDFKFIVFFSGLERSLANSAYNLRQDECKAAAYNLLAFAGLPYEKFKNTVLRNVPAEVFKEYKDRLPFPFYKRATHYFAEYDRVQKGVQAWKAGDLSTYGSLVFESGRSSIDNYECGCDELITLYEIMSGTDGIYGGRFSGAGFKGCCMALVDPAKADEVIDKVSREYLKAYPDLEGKYMAALCDTADGVSL
ncbi:MAG: GHMP kinase [Lachnospiraceae bacterium]|nr:GHMP kinase [Lachnospiraceae bacterium]